MREFAAEQMYIPESESSALHSSNIEVIIVMFWTNISTSVMLKSPPETIREPSLDQEMLGRGLPRATHVREKLSPRVTEVLTGGTSKSEDGTE